MVNLLDLHLTQHITTNLVPCILVDDSYKGKLKDGKLGDLAPTILKLIGVPIPKEMTAPYADWCEGLFSYLYCWLPAALPKPEIAYHYQHG